MIEQTIKLFTAEYGVTPMIHMVANDSGRTLRMILGDMDVNSNMTGTLSFHRADNSYYSVIAAADANTNSFTANVTQALTRPGVTKCQLKVADSNELVVSTFIFAISVQESADGLPSEQLGPDIYDLLEAASGWSVPVIEDTYDSATGNLTLTVGFERSV